MTGRERPRRDRRGRLRDGAFVAQPGRDTLGNAFVHGREPTQQRSRTASVCTLLNSKMKAETMWFCSGSVWLKKNRLA